MTLTHRRHLTRTPDPEYDTFPNSVVTLPGALLAISAVQQAAAPGIICLRGVNPYVAAALTDWGRQGGGSTPLVPRAAAPAAALPMPDALAGKMSFLRRPPCLPRTHTASFCVVLAAQVVTVLPWTGHHAL